MWRLSDELLPHLGFTLDHRIKHNKGTLLQGLLSLHSWFGWSRGVRYLQDQFIGGYVDGETGMGCGHSRDNRQLLETCQYYRVSLLNLLDDLILTGNSPPSPFQNQTKPPHLMFLIHLQQIQQHGSSLKSMHQELQWLKKCPHVSQILKDSVIVRHILNIKPNAWLLT